MKTNLKHRLGLLLIFSLSLSAIAQTSAIRTQKPAEQTPNSPLQAKTPGHGQPVDTAELENLVARDTYVFYAEVRMVGRLVGSRQISEVFDALKMLDALPVEVSRVHDFLVDHAIELDGSKAVIAAEAARPGVPGTLVTIEMESPEAVAKLEPKVAKMLVGLAKPSGSKTPAPKLPAPASSPRTKPTATPGGTPSLAEIERDAEAKGVFIKSSGSVLCIADSHIDFDALRPKNSAPMTADELFSRGRANFSSEPLFLYYNQKVSKRLDEQRRKDAEAADEVYRKRMEAEAAKSKSSDSDEGVRTFRARPNSSSIGAQNKTDDVFVTNPTPAPVSPAEADEEEGADLPLAGTADVPDQMTPVVSPSPSPSPTQNTDQAAASKAFEGAIGSLFRMGSVWPDSIAAALEFDGDDVALHAVFLGTGEANLPIPFLPFLIIGPQSSLNASTVAPSDTDLFLSVSLDTDAVVDRILKGEPIPEGPKIEKTSDAEAPSVQLAKLEAILGFRIKEDLIPAFGNEIALALSMHRRPNQSPSLPALADSTTNATFFIAVRNREAAERMLPKLLALMGLASSSADETIGNSVIHDYGSVAMAFTDSYLIIGMNSTMVRNSIETSGSGSLFSSIDFRSATQWQPQLRTGQIYLSQTAAGTIFGGGSGVLDFDGDRGKAFLARFRAESKPISYSLSGERDSSRHDLHIPMSTVLSWIGQAATSNRYSAVIRNELQARYQMMMLVVAETKYKDGPGKGSFGSQGDLIKSNMMYKENPDSNAYHVEITASADDFQIYATPLEYATTGRHSFFIDSKNVFHGGDFGGRRAGPNDPVIEAAAMGRGLLPLFD